jgi:hypothetical protein
MARRAATARGQALVRAPPNIGALRLRIRAVRAVRDLSAARQAKRKAANTMAAQISGSILSHVLGALRRAIGRIVLWFLIGFIVAGAIVEGALFAATHGFPVWGIITAVVAGLLLGYAASLTVLVIEVVRFFVQTLKDLERDVRGEFSGGARVVEGIVENIEKRL